jgi:cation diffusion facilitator family transporter
MERMTIMEHVERGKVAKKATIVGFLVNLFLLLLKFIIGIFANSAALISDAVHTLSDLVGDIIVFIGYRFTNKPADEKHNYGHGKIETIVSTIISMILIYLGYTILRNSVIVIYNFFVHDIPIVMPELIALIPVIVSIIAKELMFRYSFSIAKKIDSDTMKANAWHQRSDALSSVAALIGIGLALLLGEHFAVLDPIASFVVSLLILKVGYDIIKTSIAQLTDAALTQEDITKIDTIIQSVENIKSYGNVKTRKIGYYISIDVHIHLDPNLNVVEAHDIASELEEKFYAEFGNATLVSVHIEPEE